MHLKFLSFFLSITLLDRKKCFSLIQQRESLLIHVRRFSSMENPQRFATFAVPTKAVESLRLDKFLAQQELKGGELFSRSAILKLVKQGGITVNGIAAKKGGQKVKAGDKIQV
jgi:RNA-binding protein YlmH